jgi:NAD(P)-dependent dehydrogenase (short-subunit alcohol dehydrogenase family)
MDIELEPMDLFDPRSIDAFAAKFLASGRPLHILVNSAGIMATPLTRDARGFEAQFATNHLGHFQLTTRLLPAPPRRWLTRRVGFVVGPSPLAGGVRGPEFRAAAL